ncbi:MAG TPA: sigma-70 family RNA polymerase sigma factor [Candidatus Sulfotelmatobacter sp.]|nr:sigma-70 family RNA polymerase sigma factor [Candidatus Sulfotelmatobacter sp.]
MIDYSQLGSQELIAECLSTRQAAAWQEFVRRFQPLIAGVVARTASRWLTVTAALVDDLVQETYLKLCTEEFRRLRDFVSWHDDAIYGYLKAIAYTVTLDHFKVHYAVKRGARLQNTSDFDTSLRVEGRKSSVEDNILLRELEEMAGEVAEEDRDKLIFQLYYRQGLTTRKIAGIPAIGLSQKGVESCLHRLTERLRKRVTAGNF